jgi:hypothetical protein
VAIYIPIRKIREDNESADYSFEIASASGSLRIDKATGEWEDLSPAELEISSGLLARVVYKLRKHWKKGEFPDITSWSA